MNRQTEHKERDLEGLTQTSMGSIEQPGALLYSDTCSSLGHRQLAGMVGFTTT